MSKNHFDAKAAYKELADDAAVLEEKYKQYAEAEFAGLDRKLKALTSMKKAELMYHAFQLAEENTKLRLREKFWEIRSELKDQKGLLSQLDHDATKDKHSSGARKTKQRKDELWAHRKERYLHFRGEGFNKTKAREKVQHEEEQHGRRVTLKTLMRRLKD